MARGGARRNNEEGELREFVNGSPQPPAPTPNPNRRTNDDDESCECINTIPECGPAPDGRPHLTVAEAGGIAASCFVALLIIAVMGFYMCHKMKMKTTGDVPAKPTGAAVELPAAGGDTGPAAGVTTDAV